MNKPEDNLSVNPSADRSDGDDEGLNARLERLAQDGRTKDDPKKRSLKQREQTDERSARLKPGGLLSDGFDSLKRLSKTQRFRKGSVATLMTVLFIVFVVLTNIVAIKLTDRFAALSPDLTKNQVYTLTDTTLDMLKGLNERVEIDILASEASCMKTSLDFDPYGQVPMATELIKRYEQVSPQIKVEFIDLGQYPGYLDLVPDYRDALYDYCVVVRSARRTRVSSFYEMLPSLTSTASTDSESVDVASSLTEMLVSSMIKTVTIDTVPTVAFLDTLGGGEYIDPLLNALELNGYSILSSHDFDFGYEPIPSEAHIALISAPQYDLSQSQLIALTDFLENGGSYGKTLIVLSSPLSPKLPNLTTLLEEWGIKYTRDTVYEGDTSMVLPTLKSDVFKSTLRESIYIDDALAIKDVPVSGALCIEIPNQSLSTGIAVNPILSTTTQGYKAAPGEVFDIANYSGTDASVRYIMAEATLYRDQIDNDTQLRSDIILAPVSLCASDYMSSTVYGNFALMMNVFNKRCGISDDTLNIAAKSLTPTDFSIDSSILTMLTVILGYLVPILIAALGFIIYVRRKRL